MAWRDVRKAPLAARPPPGGQRRLLVGNERQHPAGGSGEVPAPHRAAG